jgi:hypothetical protein
LIAPTPEALGTLQISIPFRVTEDLPAGMDGENILGAQDWEHILIRLDEAGYLIRRRED